MSTLKAPSLDLDQPCMLWKTKYWRKKEESFHNHEDHRLCDLTFTQVGARVLIRKFLERDRRFLDPPDDFRYAKLQAFLLKANIRELAPSSTVGEKTILLDERKDPNSVRGATREWDDESRSGYFCYPPTGIEESIFFQPTSSREFVQRLNENSVRYIKVRRTDIELKQET